jgi:hypothetical protein
MATQPPERGKETPPADGGQPVADAQPIGMGPLREALIALAVLAFFVIWAILLIDVWSAKSGKPPDLDDVLVGAGAALAGVVGAGFALAMGLEKKKPPDESLAVTSIALPKPALPKLGREEARSWILTIGIYGYAAVSIVAVITWLANRSETPEEIQTLAIGFVSYVLALATSAFGAVRSTD